MKCKFMHVTLRSHILIIQNHALEDILLSAFDLAICTYLLVHCFPKNPYHFSDRTVDFKISMTPKTFGNHLTFNKV